MQPLCKESSIHMAKRAKRNCYLFQEIQFSKKDLCTNGQKMDSNKDICFL